MVIGSRHRRPGGRPRSQRAGLVVLARAAGRGLRSGAPEAQRSRPSWGLCRHTGWPREITSKELVKAHRRRRGAQALYV